MINLIIHALILFFLPNTSDNLWQNCLRDRDQYKYCYFYGYFRCFSNINLLDTTNNPQVSNNRYAI